MPYYPSQTQGRQPQQGDVLDQTLGQRFGTTPNTSPFVQPLPQLPQRSTAPLQPNQTQYQQQTQQQGQALQPNQTQYQQQQTQQQGQALQTPLNQPVPVGSTPMQGAQPAPTYTNPFRAVMVNEQAAPSVPTGVVTNPDGSQSIGGYTIDSNGRLINSPYTVARPMGSIIPMVRPGGVDGTQGVYTYTPDNVRSLIALAEANPHAATNIYSALANAGDAGLPREYQGQSGRFSELAQSLDIDHSLGVGQAAASTTAPQNPARYSTFGMDPALDALVQQGLVSPSRYTNDLLTSMWQDRAGQIDNQYDTANQGLMANLARQGIRDSTFGGARQQALNGQRRTAMQDMTQGLAEDIANNMSADRSRAISDALALRGQRVGQDQFSQNLDMAKMFGTQDRTLQNRQFDWTQQMDTNNFNANRQDAYDALMARFGILPGA